MLIELAILLASCDVTGAALSNCTKKCPGASGASYTICAVENKPVASKPKNTAPVSAKPKRECRYFANGTINVPTDTIITAWVDVGSRLCIGDVVPGPAKPKPKTIQEEISDAFTAFASPPFAFVSTTSAIEVGESVNFGVNPGGGTHVGTLFGQGAEIRFQPIKINWEFSDGKRLSGRYISTSFADPQTVHGVATVEYRIDYRYPNQAWVLGASAASLSSNRVSLEVVDPPRRTLLRD